MGKYCNKHDAAFEVMSGRQRCRQCVYARNREYRKRDYEPDNHCIDCGELMSGKRKKCDACRGKCSTCRGEISVTPAGHRYCKPCARRRSIKKRYSVTDERYRDLQSVSTCEVCGSDGSRGGKGLHVDHSHETGQVRGMLCHYCNLALGLVEDDPKRLIALATYLKERT